jgi:hypothetical protein
VFTYSAADSNFAITDIDAEGGFMPMSHGNGPDAHETGVEVYVGSPGSARKRIEDLGIEGIDPKLNNDISFRWSSDLMEGACAMALAAAIATLTAASFGAIGATSLRSKLPSKNATSSW